MSKPLADRVVLLTGAARGIGAATAFALARAGAHVLAVGRSKESVEPVTDAIGKEGGLATPIGLDVTDLEGMEKVADRIEADFGRLDMLVGNAAVLGPRFTLEKIDVKGWKEVVEINFTANWYLLRSFDRLLKRSDAARVVMVTSGVGSNPKVGGSIYSVSKAALDHMVRTYAAETEGTNIRVNLFNPGPTRTTMRATLMPAEDPMTLDTPEDVAEYIVAMCLPSFTDSGRLYNYPTRSLMEFRPPADLAET